MRPASSVRSAMRRPAAGLAEALARRALEAQVGRRGRVQPELLLLAHGAEALGAAAHEERAGPLAVAREDDEHVRVRAVGDPLLRARDAAVGVGGGAHRPGVRARARLGQGEGAELVALGERGHEPRDLVGRAVLDDRQRPRARVHGDGDAEPRVGARELLEHEAVGQEVGARAAVLGRHADAEQPELEARRQLLQGVLVEERRLEINGSTTYVLAAGQGPPLVLLHGGIQSGGAYWGRVIPRLAEAHRLVVPDVPGLGESEPLGRLDAETFADWFHELLRLTGSEQSTVLAHSTVGSLAARFAARGGHRLQRLVLAGTPGIGHHRMPLGLVVAAMRSDLRPSARSFERFLPWPFIDPARTRQSDPEWFAAFSAYMIDRSGLPSVRRTVRQVVKAGTTPIPSAELRRIQIPTTLIWGRHDRMVPVHLGESASSTFGWPLHVIDDAGHVPFIEQPEAFVEALERSCLPQARGEPVSSG